MYTETNKAGVKTFFGVLAVTVILATVLSYVKFIMPNAILADALIIAVFVFVGYITLTKASAVFEYSTDGSKLWVKRRIGNWERTLEIEIKKIKKITQDKHSANLPKKPVNMCASIISKDRVYYLVYTENKVKKALIFEPTQKLLEEMKRGKGTSDD